MLLFNFRRLIKHIITAFLLSELSDTLFFFLLIHLIRGMLAFLILIFFPFSASRHNIYTDEGIRV